MSFTFVIHVNDHKKESKFYNILNQYSHNLNVFWLSYLFFLTVRITVTAKSTFLDFTYAFLSSKLLIDIAWIKKFSSIQVTCCFFVLLLKWAKKKQLSFWTFGNSNNNNWIFKWEKHQVYFEVSALWSKTEHFKRGAKKIIAMPVSI